MHQAQWIKVLWMLNNISLITSSILEKQLVNFSRNVIKSCSCECPTNYAIFKRNDLFQVPKNVTRVRVLIIGGGQGGQGGEYSGGDSGYVKIEEISVTPNQVIPITVGQGGTGGSSTIATDNGHGTPSYFGSNLSAAGYGGSGGGQGCDGSGGIRCTSGGGGSDGSNGTLRSGGGTWSSSLRYGQGKYSSTLWIFINNRLAYGSGGSGATLMHPGGGGGGGILINGNGPDISAQYGNGFGAGGGGIGFGAGGGAGGARDNESIGPRGVGGNGANGLVYIEW